MISSTEVWPANWIRVTIEYERKIEYRQKWDTGRVTTMQETGCNGDRRTGSGSRRDDSGNPTSKDYLPPTQRGGRG